MRKPRSSPFALASLIKLVRRVEGVDLQNSSKSITSLSSTSARDTIPSICPILMCTAMADTIVSVNCQTAISNILPTCKQVRIDGARHEIFHETDAIRSRFWDAFDRFTEIG